MEAIEAIRDLMYTFLLQYMQVIISNGPMIIIINKKWMMTGATVANPLLPLQRILLLL